MVRRSLVLYRRTWDAMGIIRLTGNTRLTSVFDDHHGNPSRVPQADEAVALHTSLGVALGRFAT